MAAVRIMWDFLENLLPVERWVQAVGNVLKYLGLTFILLVILVLVLLAGNWGLSATQRFTLIVIVLVLIGACLVIVVILAARSGDVLFAPYERSLRAGKRYGTEQARLSKKLSAAIHSEPKETELPPPPPDHGRIEEQQ